MRNTILAAAALALSLASPAFARPRMNGYCEQGGQRVVTSGLNSSTYAMRSYLGCTVTVYVTGTSTLATIFADNAGTPLANPFAASSSTGAWFFYANSGTYDVQLSGGGIATPFTIPATTLGGTSQGISVLDFGAFCDGSTDDTSSIQDAINEAVSQGQQLLFPPGTCLSSALVIPSGLTVTGAGMGISFLKQLDGSAEMGTSFLTATGVSNVTINDMTLDGNAANQGFTQSSTSNWQDQNHVLKLNTASDVTVQRVEVKNAIYCSIYGDGLTRARFRALILDGTWGAGNIGALCVQAENGASTDVMVQGSYCNSTASNSSCFKLSGSPASALVGVSILDNMVEMGYSSTDDLLGIELYNPTVGDDSGYRDFAVSNNIVRSATGTHVFGISICGTGGNGGVVSGNEIFNALLFGMEVCASNVTVSGNTFRSSAQLSIDGNYTTPNGHRNIIVAGNVFYDPQYNGLTGSAVFVGATAGVSGGPLHGITLVSNTVYYSGAAPTSPYAFWIQGNGTLIEGMAILGNHIEGGDGTETGIRAESDTGGELDNLLISGNVFTNLDAAIDFYGNGTFGTAQILSNAFNTVTTRVNNIKSTHIQFDPNPDGTITTSGYYYLNNELLNRIVADGGDDTKPNVITFNNVNFGDELQGGIISSNSRWAGDPNWVQTSMSAYTRALFMVVGAGAWQVGFGPATSTNSSSPADNEVLRADENGVKIGGGITTEFGLASVLGASATWNPGSINSGSQAVQNVGVTGCAPGYPASAALSSLSTQGLQITASGDTDAVRVQLSNNTGAPVSPGSGTLVVVCMKTTEN